MRFCFTSKDPAAISRAVKYLEGKGYVTRCIRNGKTYGIYLTELASRRKEDIEDIADKATNAATRNLSHNTVAELKRILTIIYHNTK